MKLITTKGKTSKLVEVFIQDSSSTTGAGLTGLVFNTASLTAYYYRSGAGSATSITLATMTLGTWATGGFIVVDATNMPGVYQLGIPDAALASGAEQVIIYLKGATNMAPLVLEIELSNLDLQDTVRAGLTALPNVASGSAGAIITSGTGTAQLSVGSGLVTLAAVTHTGAVIPTVTTTTTATNLTNAPTNGDLTATMKTSVTTAATAATPVAASVTGNVGGNVVGSVASVTASVSVTGDLSATMKTSVTTACTASTPTAAAVTGAVGSVTAVGTGAITSGSFAAGAIDAAAIAASAIAASEFDQTAADKIWLTSARTLTANNVSVKKNSALSGFQFFMVDSTDHFTPKTGLTITATRSINGAAFGACTNSATEIANGWYTIDLSAADLNGNTIALKLTATGADQANILLVTNV